MFVTYETACSNMNYGAQPEEGCFGECHLQLLNGSSCVITANFNQL